MKEYNFCYSLDAKYIEQLSVSIASVLLNMDKNCNLKFYILENDLKKEHKNKIDLLKNIKNFDIEYVKMDNVDFLDCPMLKDKNEDYSSYHVTIPTYYRFILPDALKNLDKVLYLDCDVIVNNDLSKLFDENIENNATLMVLDAESKKEAVRLNLKKYFNAGVMLINLDFWRKNNVKDKLFNYAKNNKDKILWQDQDIINAVLSEDIKEIPNSWNYQYFQYEKPDNIKTAGAKILHLAGRFKPWLIPFESEIYDIYYEYLNLTPFKNKIIEYKLNASGKRLKNNIGGSVTSIIKNVSDEDLNKCFSEITKSYDFVKEQTENLNSQTDTKISKVYNEISKNYKFIEDKSIETKNDIKFQVENIINNSSKKLEEKYSLFDRFFNEKLEASVSLNQEKLNNVNVNTDLKIKGVLDIVNSITDKKINDGAKNIQAETDVKISRVYDEISKNYDYTNEQNKSLKDEILLDNDNKIKDLSETITSCVDNKISIVYDEISKNYDYTNEQNKNLKDEIINDTNIKIKDLTEEITSKTNENLQTNLNKLILDNENKTKNLFETITDETDTKISAVYDEVSKNYDYTNELNEKLKNELNSNIEHLNNKLEQDTNEKITLLNNSISDELNKKINDVIKNTVVDTDSKISAVYDEVSKNYKYTEFLVETIEEKQNHFRDEAVNKLNDFINNVKNTSIENVNNSMSLLENKINNKIDSVKDDLTQETEVKLNDLLNKINVNYDEKVTSLFSKIIGETDDKIDNLSKNLQNETDDKINNISIKLQNETDNKLCNQYEKLKNEIDNKVNSLTSDTTDKINNLDIKLQNETNEKINLLSNDLSLNFDVKIADLSNNLTKETDLKFSEIYSYTNEHASNLYKEVINSSVAIENNLNNKINDIYKNNNFVKEEINKIKSEVAQLPKNSVINETEKNLKNIIEEKELKHNIEVDNLKSGIDDRLNEQRIKYENKLIEMENKINEMNIIITELKKKPFDKFIEKFRKKK